ncbi:phosphatidylethanolamine-binding protein PEBP [Dictyostelium discoideum AX4]|uniref:Phosphatidylethanolamine-binding protein PEBP n=1 Tax=Dictyostelium discoideum TaxID=44689 RepID=Q86H88_DICDI|nr:phosphatidylethanolamine-binding protein PEBP [Dictyostelium discoideum AX4]EAL69542.1 phosphatidylethanolamine-binding protein PEBP [Dictyostelium discoideum AX4]|eukprot:XP_643418.1 phosphatidylethanolamine-binding protein PEBP [Dictyostelium discoideum AX4]
MGDLSFIEEIEKLKTNQIIPNIINSLPNRSLKVKYGIRYIDMSDKLTPIAVKDKPTIEYLLNQDGSEENQYFTLILVSVDEPSKINRLEGEFKQWILVNIKGNNISKSDELVKYIQPLPLIGTGLHRYIFILCKQPSKLDFIGEFKIPFNMEKRKDWNSEQFIKKWNLTVEGINYFECEYDDSVEKLLTELIDSKEKTNQINK